MTLFLSLAVLTAITACGSKGESTPKEETKQAESTVESNENNGETQSETSILKGSSAEDYFGKICTLGEMKASKSKEPDKDKQGNIQYTYYGDGLDNADGKLGNQLTVLSDANDEITFVQLNTYMSNEDLLRSVFSELNFEGKDDAFMEAADKYVTDIVTNGKAVDMNNISIGNVKCKVQLNNDEEQSLILYLFATE